MPSPHIEAAFSAAGAAFAEHVRYGDVIDTVDLGTRACEAVNYSLRSRGLVMHPNGRGSWVVRNVKP